MNFSLNIAGMELLLVQFLYWSVSFPEVAGRGGHRYLAATRILTAYTWTDLAADFVGNTEPQSTHK